MGLRAILALIGIVLASGGPALAQEQVDDPDHVVNCAAGETVQEAVDAAQPGDTIRISGTCAENVVVRADGITLDGSGSAVIDASGRDASTILVQGFQNVVIEGLTVRNGLFGINVAGGSSVLLEGVTIRGARSQEGSYGGFGLMVATSSVTLNGAVAVENNADGGIGIFQGGHVFVGGNASYEGDAVPRATLHVANNGGDGILLGSNSTFRALADLAAADEPSLVLIHDNRGNGIGVYQNSTVFLEMHADIYDNDLSGIDAWGDAFVQLGRDGTGQSGSITGNGEYGVSVNWARGTLAGLAIQGNARSDVRLPFGSSLYWSSSDVGTVHCDAAYLAPGCPQ